MSRKFLQFYQKQLQLTTKVHGLIIPQYWEQTSIHSFGVRSSHLLFISQGWLLESWYIASLSSCNDCNKNYMHQPQYFGNNFGHALPKSNKIIQRDFINTHTHTNCIIFLAYFQNLSSLITHINVNLNHNSWDGGASGSPM